MMISRPSAVVCGTRFGEHYLAALAHPDSPLRLAGILARGSERSRLLAEKFGVPLWRSVEQIDDAVTVACVAVRSRMVGGEGSALAEALLRRGLRVVQEHPLHPGEAARLQSLASEQGTRYHINSFYPQLPAARRFIDYVQAWRKQQPLQIIEITTSLQLLYSALDVVGHALGTLRASHFMAAPAPTRSDWPMRQLHGEIDNIPVLINLQTTLDPSDPDHHSLVMHRISCGNTSGNLCLTGSFGPVVWSHAIYAPDYHRDDAQSSWLLAPELHQQRHYNQQPGALVFGSPRGESLNELVQDAFPRGLHRAFAELLAEASPAWQQPEWWKNQGALWLDIMRQVGQPVTQQFDAPARPSPDPLRWAAAIKEESHD